VTIPQRNPGNVLQAIQKLHAATIMLEEALPLIPMGIPLHAAVMKAATELTKHIGEAKQEASTTMQTLMQAMRGLSNQSQQAMAARQTGGMPTPGQPPAMPPPSPMPQAGAAPPG
jgi:hypothetical protein